MMVKGTQSDIGGWVKLAMNQMPPLEAHGSRAAPHIRCKPLAGDVYGFKTAAGACERHHSPDSRRLTPVIADGSCREPKTKRSLFGK